MSLRCWAHGSAEAAEREERFPHLAAWNPEKDRRDRRVLASAKAMTPAVVAVVVVMRRAAATGRPHQLRSSSLRRLLYPLRHSAEDYPTGRRLAATQADSREDAALPQAREAVAQRCFAREPENRRHEILETPTQTAVPQAKAPSWSSSHPNRHALPCWALPEPFRTPYLCWAYRSRFRWVPERTHAPVERRP